jgi:hypothetical protein
MLVLHYPILTCTAASTAAGLLHVHKCTPLQPVQATSWLLAGVGVWWVVMLVRLT